MFVNFAGFSLTFGILNFSGGVDEDAPPDAAVELVDGAVDDEDATSAADLHLPCGTTSASDLLGGDDEASSAGEWPSRGRTLLPAGRDLLHGGGGGEVAVVVGGVGSDQRLRHVV